MKVLVLHNIPDQDAAVEEQDVLVQRDSVMAALARSGYDTNSYGCTLDLETLRRQLTEYRPDVVFNLVESLGGTDRLMTLVPQLLDSLQLPYTGATAAAMLAISGKPAAKQLLRQAGLPTPDWVELNGEQSARATRSPGTQWIIKPVWEHASVGMDDQAVVTATDSTSLHELLSDRERSAGRPLFAESFVDGREFNLSMLGGEVLPPAEIDFSSFPANKPRIVGQRAKWEPDSFEYLQTPRRFDFPSSDTALLDQLAAMACDCWKVFALTGFARVDFRVDSRGRPWILEVNVNPCLSPDAGFAAALQQAGLMYDHAIEIIIRNALSTAYYPVSTTR